MKNPNGVVQLPPVFRDTEPTTFKAEAYPWHITDPEYPRHWDWSGAGEGVLVGIADTGLDHNHREIKGRVHAMQSFVGGDTMDRNGHGTHVTTTIAGGGVGCAPRAEVAMAKVLGDNGAGTNEGVAKGIDWLVKIGCKIINLSLGGAGDDPYSREAVLKAIDAGVLVCAATGNERAARVGYPARYCIAVGAIDRRFRLADFSNTGKDVDIVNYGVGILAGVPGDQYQEMSGTSMATPNTCGAGANLLSAEIKHLGKIVTTSPNELLKLQGDVVDLGITGPDTSYGRGRPDLDKLLYDHIKAVVTPPPVTPPPVGGALRLEPAPVGYTGPVYVIENMRLKQVG